MTPAWTVTAITCLNVAVREDRVENHEIQTREEQRENRHADGRKNDGRVRADGRLALHRRVLLVGQRSPGEPLHLLGRGVDGRLFARLGKLRQALFQPDGDATD